MRGEEWQGEQSPGHEEFAELCVPRSSGVLWQFKICVVCAAARTQVAGVGGRGRRETTWLDLGLRTVVRRPRGEGRGATTWSLG